MRIKLLCENLLIGAINYVKGHVLDYEIDGARKDQLIKDGQAIVTDEAAGKSEFKAAIPVKVEDKATIFHPVEGATQDERGPEGLKVTADSELTPEGKPAKIKAEKK